MRCRSDPKQRNNAVAGAGDDMRQADVSLGDGLQFDAFISYSRRDAAFAATLERALEGFRVPAGIGGGSRRRIEVFRDEEDMTGAAYYDAIERHLAASRKLIVLCSPASRASEYVNDEIRRFAAHHGSEHIIPVLLSGLPNNVAGDTDPASHAFPEALCELVRMPLAVNYAGFDLQRDRIRRGSFEASWYLLLSNLLDVSRAEIEERDRRRRARQRNRWTGGLMSVIAVLSVLAAWALWERARAVRRGEITLAGALATQARSGTDLQPEAVERRVLMAVEAVRRLQDLGEPDEAAMATLREVLALLPRRVLQFGAGQRAVAFSGDGRHAAVAGPQGLAVHALQSGDRTALLDSGRVWTSVFASEAGDWVGAVDAAGPLALWRLSPRPGQIVAPDLGGLQALCGGFSPDGAHIVALLMDRASPRAGRLRAWTADGARLIAEQPVELPAGGVEPPADGPCLDVGREHALLRAAASGDDEPGRLSATVWLWRPAAPTAFGGPPPQRGWLHFAQWSGLRAAALTADGRSLMLAGGDFEAARVNLHSPGSPGGPPLTHAVLPGAAMISPNGRLLVGVQTGEDPYVPRLRYAMYNFFADAPPRSLGTVVEQNAELWLSHSGQLAVTAAGRRVRLWSPRTGQELLRVPAGVPAARVVVSRSERHLALLTDDGAMEVWEVGHPAEFLRVPGGRLAASAAQGTTVAVGHDRGILVIDGAGGGLVGAVALPGPASLVTISATGRHVLASNGDGLANLLAGAAGTAVLVDVVRDTVVSMGSGAATAAAFSPDGAGLLVGREDSTLSMLHVETGATRWQRRLEGRAGRIAFSADGRTAAVAVQGDYGYARSVLVMGASSGELLRRVEAQGAAAAALSDDGAVVAVVRGGSLVIGRVSGDTTARAIELPATLPTVQELRFLSGGRIAATLQNHASGPFGPRVVTEQALFAWDIATGEPVWRLPAATHDTIDGSGTAAQEDRPYFAEVAWSSDGAEVAAIVYASPLNYLVLPWEFASSDVRVWSTRGRYPAEIFRMPAAEVERVVAIGAGATLLATVADDALRLRRTDAAPLMAEACRRVTRNLTRAEWADLMGPSARYRATCPGVTGTPDDQFED